MQQNKWDRLIYRVCILRVLAYDLAQSVRHLQRASVKKHT